ncbi:hypothetical protein [Pseudomonas abyssi]|uniref:hypothetical protein n=1 Tax=Pseudomonas abyssi TaxID=170540 RepID=UPI003C7C7358
MDDIKLLGLQRSEFQRAENLQIWAGRVQVIIVLVSILCLVIQEINIIHSLSIVSILLALAWFYISEESKTSHSTAERARRAIVIRNGLGIQLSAKSYSDLILCFKASSDSAEQWEDEEYFKSESEYGNQKLAEIIEESAFWSKFLLREYAKKTWLIFSCVLAISVFSLFLITFFDYSDLSKTVGQILCLVLMWLITGSLFSKSIKLTSSSNAVDSIEERLNSIIQGGNIKDDILIYMCDYNSIIEGTPVIPSKIYLKNKDRLNSLWRERAER